MAPGSRPGLTLNGTPKPLGNASTLCVWATATRCSGASSRAFAAASFSCDSPRTTRPLAKRPQRQRPCSVGTEGFHASAEAPVDVFSMQTLEGETKRGHDAFAGRCKGLQMNKCPSPPNMSICTAVTQTQDAQE